jgi:hypothetical protein
VNVSLAGKEPHGIDVGEPRHAADVDELVGGRLLGRGTKELDVHSVRHYGHWPAYAHRQQLRTIVVGYGDDMIDGLTDVALVAGELTYLTAQERALQRPALVGEPPLEQPAFHVVLYQHRR